MGGFANNRKKTVKHLETTLLVSSLELVLWHMIVLLLSGLEMMKGEDRRQGVEFSEKTGELQKRIK